MKIKIEVKLLNLSNFIYLKKQLFRLEIAFLHKPTDLYSSYSTSISDNLLNTVCYRFSKLLLLSMEHWSFRNFSCLVQPFALYAAV
jgi:hypothetical protein